jgi:phosphoribosylformylglycinamidine synthase subunit PurL
MSGNKKVLCSQLKDTDLTTTAHAREMGLSDDEFARATALIGRTPNKVELGCIAAMWSEHCSYKSSKHHLRKLPTTGPAVLVGPGENAGVVDIGGGHAVAFKVESHNHPSFIEPYQGAATGVGGILRDVFTMGARPIAAMNLLRFGAPHHPKTKTLVDGVVRGIGGYGNCFGVPTVYSNAEFDPAFNGNVLVNAFALGVLKHNGIFLGTAKGVGNPVLYVGAKTGRDGIHGATMSSDAFSDTRESERPTVQVGDPFKEKLLVEALMELFQRGADLLVGIQDMGAAGLTSSAFEMASRAGSGVELDLDKVPARESGMSAYEFMLSESQERMLLVAKAGKEAEVKALFARWDLDCVVIGAVNDSGRVRLRLHGALMADLPAAPLADEAPRYDEKLRPYRDAPAAPPMSPSAWAKTPKRLIEEVLLHPTAAPKSFMYDQFDREVGAGTFYDGTHAPAALVRVPGTHKAVAMALCCNSRHASLDPRGGGMRAVVEGIMRIACVGAHPIGVTDCLNYGSPLVPEVMGQIVAGIEGIAEACKAFEVPVVSGNVSLYNQTDDVAVLPTPTCGVVGLVDDAALVTPRTHGDDGDLLIRLGESARGLEGSLALWLEQGRVGSLPALDVQQARAAIKLVRKLRLNNDLIDAEPVLVGGLVQALMVVSERAGVGLRAQLAETDDVIAGLVGECTTSFVVVAEHKQLGDIQRAAAKLGVSMHVLGSLRAGAFELQTAGGDVLYSQDASALHAKRQPIIDQLVNP